VNLIGEHTDYNEGFVLPMAIERVVAIAFAARGDRRLRAHSVHFGETREVVLDALRPHPLPRRTDWMAYVEGMAWAFERNGRNLVGLDLIIDSDLPREVGLSSSAALEMATARSLCEGSAIRWEPSEAARLGQRAENEYVGVQSGIMDQFASALCQAGHALLLDCRSLRTRNVPLPRGGSIAVINTGVSRALVGGAYNERRASCDAALRAVRHRRDNVRTLRDVDEAMLIDARRRMDELTYRRALHVIRENRRPVALATALADEDLEAAGLLMNESHESLRDLYEVSSSELDSATELARGHPACFGARMCGAGFGGCAIALVRSEAMPAFVEEVAAAYRATVDPRGDIFETRPSAGARLAD
jgi:galactokinase